MSPRHEERRSHPLAGSVTVRRLDGTVEVKPAYNRRQLRRVIGWDKQTRRLMAKGEA